MTLTTRPAGGKRTGPPPGADGGPVATPRRRLPRRPKRDEERPERSILSSHDMARPGVRAGVFGSRAVILTLLFVVAVGPVLWLAKAAVSSTRDTLGDPFGLWPSGIRWGNLEQAWTTVRLGRYLANTFWVAGGSAVLTLFVALTGAYALSVLRPRYAKAVNALVLATLFVPSVVILVPLYLTVLDVPLLGVNLMNSFWAVWLPTAANSFIVLIVKRFFDSLPRELFEVAKVDGAGPFRIFWHLVLPMSRPIIGVTVLLSFVTGWKEFLWPLLVLPDAEKQPLSVALPRLSETAELSLLMAGLFLSVIIPVLLFLLFQRQFLRAAGQSGAIKG